MNIRHYIQPTYGYHVYQVGRFCFRIGWNGRGEWGIMPFRTDTAMGCAFWAFGLFLQIDWDLL